MVQSWLVMACERKRAKPTAGHKRFGGTANPSNTPRYNNPAVEAPKPAKLTAKCPHLACSGSGDAFAKAQTLISTLHTERRALDPNS